MSEEKIYKLIKLLFWFLGRFPRSVLLFSADCLATIWYLLDKRHRNVVINNLQLAYPGKFTRKQAHAFARKNLRHTASIIFEVIWSLSLKKEKLLSYFSIEGMENLEKALAKERGIIALTCHLGVFELLISSVAAINLKPYALYRKLDFAPLERVILEARQRFGVTMLPIRGASGKVDALLKQKEVVVTLLDQNVDWYKGVFVDFFGRRACTNNGLAKLVLRAEPVVLPAYLAKKDNRFILKIFPEIPIQKTGDRIKDIENNTQAYASAVEMMVRQSPHEYFWVHNRWKTRPYCLLETKEHGI